MSQATFERARLSRDARFDGRFFVGVKTTGIYCRPICPATQPRVENVTFFPTAAAASEAGFRPCLRCRPECAPGTPAWAGTSTTVSRGLRLIAEGALEDGNVERLADRLGVTSRHLRRLFTRHVGASPLAVAHTQRLHFAKRLIDQTTMPIKEIALVAGYGSVRRFNDAFRRTYDRSPRELRRTNRDATSEPAAGISLRVSYRTPFDWQSLLDFFAARAIPGVELASDDTYSRTIVLDGQPGLIEVGDDPLNSSLRLTVFGAATQQLFPIVQRSRQIFDVDAPVDAIASLLGKDEVLKPLLTKRRGVRVPGAWDGFELTVRAIVGQQVSVSAATTLAGRIAARYGTPIDIEAGRRDAVPGILFPTPEKLMRARFNDMGIVGSRIETIRHVARAVAKGELSFEGSQDHDEFCRQLTRIRGIGDWTAQYIAMRALKHPDAFPASDLGLLRAFDRPGRPRIKPAELSDRADRWRPWRSYAALLLWGHTPGSGG